MAVYRAMSPRDFAKHPYTLNWGKASELLAG
jgi:hypothetical protein